MWDRFVVGSFPKAIADLPPVDEAALAADAAADVLDTCAEPVGAAVWPSLGEWVQLCPHCFSFRSPFRWRLPQVHVYVRATGASLDTVAMWDAMLCVGMDFDPDAWLAFGPTGVLFWAGHKVW